MKQISGLSVLLFVTFTYIFITICGVVSAKESTLLPTVKEKEVPEDFSFSVHETQTDHMFFEQAVAQENGTFAICVRFTETAPEAFSKVYVDVFEADGAFWKEICFSSPFEVTIELKDNFLNLIFYDYMITIDLNTEEIKCFEIEANSLRESGLYSILHQDQFSCGGWDYQCKKSTWGYSEVRRSNGMNEQVLISYSGIGPLVLYKIMSFIFLCLPFLVIIVIKKRYRKKNNK